MYYVIVNPASRSGRGRKLWSELEPVFLEKRIAYRAVFSKGTGHVTRIVEKLTEPLVQDANAGPIRLILLGGDGTVNEALQGIRDFERVWIGYIPTGSSNDLARDLKLSTKPEVLLSSILEGEVKRTMDLGLMTCDRISEERSACRVDRPSAERYFAVSGGIGFDAAVCEEALSSRFKNTLNRIGLGKLTYLVIALRQLLAAKRVSCDLYLDGADKPVHLKQLLFTAFMIHRYEGGGFMFCPQADACDGQLDLCVTGNIPKPLILLALPTAFFGKHYLFPQIRHYRTTVVRLETSVPMWVHTDGEVSVKSDRITVRCIPQKIRLLV